MNLKSLVIFFVLVVVSMEQKVLGVEKNHLLSENNIKTISFILASNKGIGRSTFGHAYIRVGYEDKVSVNDQTIEFVADVEEKDLSYLRAVGIGKKYNMKIVKTSYQQVYNYHVLGEDRDLTTYTLKLTEDQKYEIVQNLNELLKKGLKNKYTFFSSNCAKLVISILNSTLEDKINGMASIIPSKIPSKLKKLDLISNIYVDDRISIQRKKAVNRYFPKFLNSSHHNLEQKMLVDNLKEGLLSRNISKRIMAYHKLHILRENRGLKEGLQIGLLASKLGAFENVLVKDILVKLFTTKKQQLRLLNRVYFKFSNKHIRSIHKTRLKVKDDKVFLEITVNIRDDRKKGMKRRQKAKYKFPLDGLKYKNGEIVDENGVVISYKVDKELNETGFYHPSTYLNAEIVSRDNEKYIVALLLTETARVKPSSKIDYFDELSIKNGEYKNKGLCYAHSELSQILESRAIYAPHMTPLSSDQNAQLIRDLFAGLIVTIPGYNNANEFTNSLDKEILGELLSERFKEAYNFKERFFEYFSDIRIKSKNFYNIKNLLEMGVHPIVYFIPEGRKMGHSILVASVEEDENYYYINAIDPNMTFQKKHFKLNKKTSMLETIYYGKTELFLPSIDLNREATYLYITRRKKLRELAIHTAKVLKNFSFSLRDFLK